MIQGSLRILERLLGAPRFRVEASHVDLRWLGETEGVYYITLSPKP